MTGPIVDHLSLGSDYYDCARAAQVKVSDFKIPFFIQGGFYLVSVAIVYFYLDIELGTVYNNRKSSDCYEIFWSERVFVSV